MGEVARFEVMHALEQSLWEHLKDEAESLFRFKILRSVPIKRGWLNQKWKIETNQGTFLLKQYNPERFKKYDLQTIQIALETQNRAFQNGIRCPELLEHEGNLLHTSGKGELFTVMCFMEGDLIKPGEATYQQMESLGEVVGKLHKLFNEGYMPARSETLFKIPPVSERLQHWHSTLDKCMDDQRPLFLLQKEATAKLKDSDFEYLTPGWCHRDLWVDNLLFSSESVSAILDFDRMNYDFIETDIGRLIISACLQKDKLNVEGVHAFIRGYCNTNELSIERLCRSLKVVWYMESTWWISLTFHEGEPPKRFANEMIWLAKNMERIDSILLGKM
ncbi:phosphotransferase [Fictibacillus barbaricus]|uniref:Homoserine kinase type II n=1 Tax=Fictibacillus barbaricus TaxID=182136 RepID=A0ABU1TVY6_9BACL|nr:phosphotransferase [Fictibacillus barbaricus]MDR7071363.1 homoserine kinase type II [Fictibacillus barbaricus]